MFYIVAQTNKLHKLLPCNKEPLEWTTVYIKNMQIGNKINISQERIAVVRN